MKKVLLIDSGSGGVNVLRECLKVCPCCDYLLFCDDKNLPYGNKDKEQLIEISLKNLETIYQFFKFEVVIFACNTLTAVCLEECKEKFSQIEFFGVEPLVESALDEFCADEVLVIATQNTVRYCKKLELFRGNVLSIESLAGDIDENLDCLWRVSHLLEERLGGFKGKIKAVVLGCTHYVAVKEMIVETLGEVKFFDGGKMVAEQLKNYIEKKQQKDLVVNENGVILPNYQIQIMTSGSQERRNQFLWWLNRE